MLQTILPIALWTPHGGIPYGVNQRFTGYMCALIRVIDIWLFCRRVSIAFCIVASRPFPRLWAFMRCFAAVVEAECPVTGSAAEGEEVELAAVRKLAVAADGFKVFVC